MIGGDTAGAAAATGRAGAPGPSETVTGGRLGACGASGAVGTTATVFAEAGAGVAVCTTWRVAEPPDAPPVSKLTRLPPDDRECDPVPPCREGVRASACRCAAGAA